jgi:hypothetical protein
MSVVGTTRKTQFPQVMTAYRGIADVADPYGLSRPVTFTRRGLSGDARRSLRRKAAIRHQARADHPLPG